MDMLLVVVKIVGIIMTGLLGVLSSVLKIRDASGSLTRKGKIFIAGSVAGLCIAMISQILETYLQRQAQAQAQAESLESTRKLQRIMADLNRSLQPLGSFSVYVYRAKVSLEGQEFEKYRNRLDAAIDGYLRKGQRERMAERDLNTPTGYGHADEFIPTSVEIRPEGRFYPSPKDGSGLGSTMFPMCYRFVFFKEPINASEYRPKHHFGAGLGDLRAVTFMPNSLSLYKDLKTDDYSIGGTIDFDNLEDVTGKIFSIPDLAGAQLLVSTCGRPESSWTWVGKKKVYKVPVDTKLEMGTMLLQFNKRKMWIQDSELKRFERSDEIYWEYRFPNTEEGVANLFSGVSGKGG